MSPKPDASRKATEAAEETKATVASSEASHSPLSDDWDSALKHGLVSFYQLVIAFYQTLDGDENVRTIAVRYHPHLLAGYQKAYGGIKQKYYGANVVCAAVLTDTDRIDIITPAVDGRFAEALGLVNKCDALTIQINSVLTAGSTKRTIMETVYGVTIAALAVIEDTVPGQKPDEGRLALVRSQLEVARLLYEKAAQRQARVQYFTGVLLGLGIAVPVMALGAGLVSLGHVGGLSPVDFLGVVSAGALGAAVSVLTRLSSDGLVLDVEAGSGELLRLGVVRPFLGSVLGLAAYWLLSGGFIPIKVPDATTSFNFYAGLAFLMGFSERFAQDMLSLGQSKATKSARGAKAGASEQTAADQSAEAGAADAPKIDALTKRLGRKQPK